VSHGGCVVGDGVSAAVAQRGHNQGSGTGLFKDFQILGRVWAHPWCLHLNYMSKENKVNQGNILIWLSMHLILSHIVQSGYIMQDNDCSS